MKDIKQEERMDLGPVYLRPITLEDTDRIIRWRNSDRVRKNFIDQRPFTRQGHLNWLETRVATGEVVQFILCETETDRPVGSVYIRDIDRKNRKGEYGISSERQTRRERVMARWLRREPLPMPAAS